MRILAAAAGLCLLVSPAAAEVAALPDLVRALLDAAYTSGDADEIDAVRKATRQVFPDYADLIDADAARAVAALEPAPKPDRAAQAESEAAADGAATAGGMFAIRPWDGKFQAGASNATGNSDNLAIGLSLQAARPTGDFVHNVKAYVDIAKSDDETTQRRWGASYKLDYVISDYRYAYGRFSYDEDEFSGFDYRLFAGAGLGQYAVKSDHLLWKVEGGPGFRYSPIDVSREIDREFAVYGSTDLEWKIREGVKFNQEVNTTWTEPTTSVQSISSISTEFFDGLSTAISFEYRYETDPPDGKVNTDTVARASLVYGF